ncbi:MAG: Protein kinase protein [Magnetococcales bacterium]|nr:Protein kinase protein [Magnetococcales bacterium]HIJ84128.1 protein kinase [Magnetococcales bacterium]
MAVIITSGPGKKGRVIPNRPLFLPGDHVADDRYRVLSLLGEGSFGQVYKVCEVATGAVKAMKRASHVKSRRLFATELQNLSRLKGTPHVLPLCDHFIDEDGSAVFITEYLDGGNLKEAIVARGRLSIAEAMGVLDQMTRALAAAHALDPPILHRDIKPSNILGKKSGENRVQWYLSDWGLAVDWSGSREPVVSGTYSYTAPEVWEHKRYPVSDVYSLGMTLYFMLFGRPAFEGGSTVVRRLQCAPEPVVIAESCPPRLKNLLEGMLTKDPGKRWSLAQVMTHLRGGRHRPQGIMVLQTRLPAGRLWRAKVGGGDVMDFSWIPGGTVDLSRFREQTENLWMARYPVIQRQFGVFVRETGHVTQAEQQGWGWVWRRDVGQFVACKGVAWNNPGFDQGEDHPVVLVSYRDARSFVRWFSGSTGRLMFLPSQLQWQWACRGGGPSAPNSLGLVYGQIHEWTQDEKSGGGELFYSQRSGPENPETSAARMICGGIGSATQESEPSACHGWAREDECNDRLGFRVAGLALPWES